MSARRHVEEIGSAAMLAGTRSTGVAPEVNFREHVTRSNSVHSVFPVRT